MYSLEHEKSWVVANASVSASARVSPFTISLGARRSDSVRSGLRRARANRNRTLAHGNGNDNRAYDSVHVLVNALLDEMLMITCVAYVAAPSTYLFKFQSHHIMHHHNVFSISTVAIMVTADLFGGTCLRVKQTKSICHGYS